MDLTVQPRNVLGKKVKALRRQGITPIHVFGPGSPSQSLQTDTVQLQHLLATTPRTAMIQLTTAGNGGGPSYTVMVKDLQRHPMTGALLHVDFYRVEMSHPVVVDVPVVFTGTSPAVENRLGTLVQGATTLRVQGLPGDLPAAIELDMSILTESHQSIHARDITLPAGIALLSDGELMLVNVVPPRGAEEVVAEAEAAAPEEAEAAAPEAETEEAGAPEAEETREGA